MAFRELVGDTAVLYKSGTFSVCQLYDYRGWLFAGFGSKYVRLNANGTTSVDKLFVDSYIVSVSLYVDKLGRLATVAGANQLLSDGVFTHRIALTPD